MGADGLGGELVANGVRVEVGGRDPKEGLPAPLEGGGEIERLGPSLFGEVE